MYKWNTYTEYLGTEITLDSKFQGPQEDPGAPHQLYSAYTSEHP